MNKKKFLSIFLIGIFFFGTAGKIFSAPINLSHKSGEYKNAFNLEINFSEPVKKVMRTKNPDGSPDEMFVYEKKIPIKYSQEIWYFGLLDGYRATKFFVNKYILKIDQNKFNYGFKFSRFSPNNNWIEIRNEGKKEKMAIGRTISGLNFEEKLPIIRLLPGQTTQIYLKKGNEIGDNMDRLKLIDPNGQTRFETMFTENIGKDKYYEKDFGDNILRIKK